MQINILECEEQLRGIDTDGSNYRAVLLLERVQQTLSRNDVNLFRVKNTDSQATFDLKERFLTALYLVLKQAKEIPDWENLQNFTYDANYFLSFQKIYFEQEVKVNNFTLKYLKN